MPKGRIGLSLSEDALEMLADLAKGKLRTRTQAIEMAIRVLWCMPESEHNPDAEMISKSDLATQGLGARLNGVAVKCTTTQPDDEPNSLSPEAVQSRAEKKAARAGRKAELAEQARAGLKAITGAMPEFPEPERTVTVSIVKEALPLERGRVEPLTKPGKR